MTPATEHDRDARARLRAWIVQQNGKLRADALRDDTPIIERRILTSLQVLDLILFLESLRGAPIDVTNLQVGAFRSIDAICRHFLEASDERPPRP